MNPADDIRKVPHLGLEVYRHPKCANKWHFPVCAATPAEKARLSGLRPNHPTAWEEVDLDGCPTLCYVLTGKELKAWRRTPFTSVWAQFEDRLGKGPAKHYFPDLWLRHNNIKAHNRNTWEAHHGGLRGDRFDRGPSLRAVASLSLT